MKKKFFTAGLVLTCALVLGACGRNLGQEIQETEFVEIWNNLSDDYDVNSIKLKGFINQNDKKVEYDWTVTESSSKEEKSQEVLDIFESLMIEYGYAGAVLYQKLGATVKFYKLDGNKLGISAKGSIKNDGLNVNIDEIYQWDQYGNPIYAKSNITGDTKGSRELTFTIEYKPAN